MSKKDLKVIDEKTRHLAKVLESMAALIGEQTGETITLDGQPVGTGMKQFKSAQDLRVIAGNVRQGLFILLILGEFKNGKSTLLNALLGLKVLPAKATPCTAIITQLVYGDRPEARVYYRRDPADPGNPDWNPETPVVMTYDDFNREFSLTIEDAETIDSGGRPTRFDDVLYAEISTECLLMQHGVTAVDSPGLGEAEARTATTLGFLGQAQAVVMTLTALKIFSQKEKEFIEVYMKEAAHQGRVFFLVNRFDQIEEDQREEMLQVTRHHLRPYFTDAGGRFDEALYARRVFFVSGYQALKAREAAPVDAARLEASGVEGFEQTLTEYLAGDERWTAATDAIFQKLGVVFAQSHAAIVDGKALAHQTLEVLEARRAALEGDLERAVCSREEIEGLIGSTSRLVQSKVYSSLQDHITEMEATWPERALDALPSLRGLTILRALPMLNDEGKKKQFSKQLEGDIQKYVEAGLGEWAAKKAMTVVSSDLLLMREEVEARAHGLLTDLVIIRDVFTGRDPSERKDMDVTATLNLLLQELRGLAPSATSADVSGPVMKMLVNQILVSLGILFLFGPLSIVALIVAAIVGGKMAIEKIKKDSISKTGHEMFPELRKTIAESEPKLKAQIADAFAQASSHLGRELQGQIDQVKREMDTHIEDKRQEGYDARTEVARLEALRGELGRRAAEMAAAVGRPVPPRWLLAETTESPAAPQEAVP